MMDNRNDDRYAAKTEVAQSFTVLQGHLIDLRIGQLITRKELYRREEWELEALGQKMTPRDVERARQLKDAIKEVDDDLASIRSGQSLPVRRER